ncbi:MAG TPA: SUMF1/EgtB/PvdO family nonheme iron enzyme [Anaerolineales bacterium]|jgi:formylglycine-generating enzyme required for sulfatase activity
MRCPHCGGQHPDNAQFCPFTGNPLDHSSKSSNKDILRLGIIGVLLLILVIYLFLSNNDLSDIFTQQTSTLTADVSNQQKKTSQSESSSDQIVVPIHAPTQDIQPTTSSTLTVVSNLSHVEIKINPSDGAELVFIPAGEFLMGSNRSEDPYFWGAEAPKHVVFLNSFWIYRSEVTQGMYQNCDEVNACPSPEKINNSVAKQYGNSQFKNYPVTMVTWQDALAYCQWAGGRLPTEAEWEKSARGTDGRLFPWGNSTNADGLANFSSSSPSSVGSYPSGASPYGLFDMSGNVLEWVNDYFEPLYYQSAPAENPLGPLTGTRKVIRGGAFNQNEINGLRTVARASLKPTDTKISVGFRCVIDNP